MLASSKDSSFVRVCAMLLAALWCAPALATAAPPLEARIAEIREDLRFTPSLALTELLMIEAAARTAPPAVKVEFLAQLALTKMRLGKNDEALLLATEATALGRSAKDNRMLARGLMIESFAQSAMGQLKQAHVLAAECEKLANTTADMALRAQAATLVGQSFAADGDFPSALKKIQEAVALARALGQPLLLLSALTSMADLSAQMKLYDKGFEALDEAWTIAATLDATGPKIDLRSTEYSLAIETNQPKRARDALLAELALERQIGATTRIPSTLVNLSDSYLKEKDYANVIRFGNQSIAAATPFNDNDTIATARINIGQAQMGLGHVAEGKRSFEAGMAYYEKTGNKPELQATLMEYGPALERVGDLTGAISAYHRERALSDELFESQRQKSVWELQEKYEMDKKQRQILLLSRENQVKSTEIDNRRLQQRVWWLLALVFALASVIVGMLYRRVRHANAQLEVKNQELKQQSVRDPLTALYNRRHFQDFMRAHTESEQLGVDKVGEEIVGALFLLDVDHFKHVNDQYGHAAGDAVLKMIANNLREILRETDMIVRWGGEEFLAFLPAIPRSGVEDIARRILGGISSHTIEYQNSKISVNVSIGFAPYPLIPADHPLPWERAVNLVDMALYLAKAHGRNRAYGVRGFTNFGQTSMEAIEENLELAWRDGFVDLSIVHGSWPEPKPLDTPSAARAPSRVNDQPCPVLTPEPGTRTQRAADAQGDVDAAADASALDPSTPA